MPRRWNGNRKHADSRRTNKKAAVARTQRWERLNTGQRTRSKTWRGGTSLMVDRPAATAPTTTMATTGSADNGVRGGSILQGGAR